MMIRNTPLWLRACNTDKDGSARTIKAVMYKVSCANFIHSDGLGATGVMIVYEK